MRVLYGWGSARNQQRLAAVLLAFFASMIVTSVVAQAPASEESTIKDSAVTVTTTSLPEATVGVRYTAPPLSATRGRPPYTFTVVGLPTGLSVNRGGVISGTPTEPGNFMLTITATDSSRFFKNRSEPKKITLIVKKAPPLTVTTASLSGASWERLYSTPLAASGGTRPYTFKATGLPKGLKVTGNAITGVPFQAGTFYVSITVTDSTPRAAGGSYTSTTKQPLELRVTPPTIIVTNRSLRPGKQGQSYSSGPLSALGGTRPYSFTATGLPNGLGVNNGAITGVPEQAGTFYVNITATDDTSSADGGPFKSQPRQLALQIARNSCVSPPCPRW